MSVQIYAEPIVLRALPWLVIQEKGVHPVAELIANRARGYLAAHRNTGASSITVKRGRKDYFVVLDDNRGPGDANKGYYPDAMAIEFGHFDHRSGKFVPGLYVLSSASGLI